MLETIKRLFADTTNTDKPDAADQSPTLARSMAALMVQAAQSDGEYKAEEKTIIHKALKTSFDLTEDEANDLTIKAEEAARSALDLHQFTKNAKQLSSEEKIELVETLWKIVMSDAARDPYEDAFMRRLCGLIYVSDRESGEARQRAVSNLQNK